MNLPESIATPLLPPSTPPHPNQISWLRHGHVHIAGVFVGEVSRLQHLPYIKSLVGTAVKSDIVTVHFNVTYHLENCCPVLYIILGDIEEDKFDYQEGQCFSDAFLRANANSDQSMWWLKPNDLKHACLVSADNVVTCTGNSTLLSAESTTWNITMGFPCNQTGALEFKYEIDLYTDVQITCQEFGSSPSHDVCKQFYPRYTTQNLVGFTQENIDIIFSTSINPYTALECYQHLLEFQCQSLLPECVNGTFRRICKQMCRDFVNGCQKGRKGWYIGCSACMNTLDPALCHYRPVTCPTWQLENGSIFYSNESITAGTLATLQCQEDFLLVGEAIAGCELNGKWNFTGQHCELPADDHFTAKLLVLTLIIGGVALLMLVFMTHRGKTDVTLHLHTDDIGMSPFSISKNVIYDYFLAYSSEDYRTARHKICVPLETDPYILRFCMDDRDFLPGKPIQRNIKDCLRQSRGAIMLISQHFVNSKWCHKELETAYAEMQDPSFMLVLVLMQDFKTLHKPPQFLKDYYEQFTCISMKDPDLLRKLSDCLKTESTC